MMKEVARYAEKAGVVVALEDWISAEDNIKLLDAIGSDFVGVYYDARNIKSRLKVTIRTVNRSCSASAFTRFTSRTARC